MKTLILVVSGSLLLATGRMSAQTETSAAATFDIRTLRGVTYYNCRITNSTPAYITVIHDGGVARIKFENLSRDWREKFNFDPAKASNFLMQESEIRRQKEAAYKELAARHAKEEEQRLAALAERVEASQRVYPAIIPFPGDASDLATSQAVEKIEENVIPDSPSLGKPYTPGKGYQRNSRSTGFISTYPSTNFLPYTPVWTVPYSYHYCPPNSISPGASYFHYSSPPQIWMGPTTIRITR